jgi:serine/threonine-protein kinase
MAGNPQMLELLEEMLDSGKTPEEVCRDCPELLPEVRERWQEFRRIDAQLGELLPGLRTPPLADAVPPARAGAGLPQVPGYEMETVLGHGGMGVVYVARQRALDRRVAVKMLLAGPFAGPQELGRFRRETAALARLQHPNIVQVYDAGDVEGRPYFAMELVEGGSLAKKLSGTPQPPRSAAALLATLAEAIHAAHQSGIVHRDLKPANILLAADGTPKVADFGLAGPLEGGAGLTQTGVPMGTPGYMAPEQARGEARALGLAVDVYALGAILYEQLTGRPPFRAATPAETLRQVVDQEPAPPSRLNAGVPRDAETICLKCLEKDPRKRYASAAALAEDLQRFQRDEPIVARSVGTAGRALRWARRRPAAAGLVATALALVGLALGGAAWLVQQRAERRAELRSEVDTAVAQAESLRKGFHFREARQLLEEARQRLGPAGPDDLRRQVDQARDELELAENLDKARLRAAAPVEGGFGTVGAESQYAESLYEQTLAKAGLGGPGDDSAAVAARVRDSSRRAEIVAALDDWASITADPARRAWLLAVARGADPDPARDRLRQPELWDDGPGLTKLVNELPVDGLSLQLTTSLGRVLLNTGGEAVPFLTAAQTRHPQDFWLNFELGWALFVSRRSDEGLGFYRAALALRPEASAAHLGVGETLGALGRWDEAIGHYKQALDFDPNFAMVHHNLGDALRANGRQDEAISHFQEAIRIDPKRSARSHNGLGFAPKLSTQVNSGAYNGI